MKCIKVEVHALLSLTPSWGDCQQWRGGSVLITEVPFDSKIGERGARLQSHLLNKRKIHLFEARRLFSMTHNILFAKSIWNLVSSEFFIQQLHVVKGRHYYGG